MTSTIDSGIDTGNDSSESSFQEKMYRPKLDKESWETSEPESNTCVSDNLGETYPVPIHRPTPAELGQERNYEPQTSTSLPLLPSPTGTARAYQLSPIPEYFANCTMPNVISSCDLLASPFAREYAVRDHVTKRRPSLRDPFRFHTPCVPAHYYRSKRYLKLFRAVSHNNTDQVKELLMADIRPNCYDPSKRTPLHLAACMGYTDMVKLLLDYGADPNAKDSKGNTPLHLAACTNHVRVMSLLMEAGTRLSEKDLAGHSPLQLAITKLNIMKRAIKPNLALQEQIAQVVQMMREHMKREEHVEPALLSRLFSVMQVKDSSEDVESNVQQLLSNLSLTNKS